MAKKSRTPAPPRVVQAPKRRDTRKAPQQAAGRRNRMILYAVAAAGIVALAVVIAVVARGGGGSSSKPAPPVDWSALPGLQKGPAPWGPGFDGLPDRLGPLGLPALSAEALAFHIHQHLDIFINGKQIHVPGLIGINDNQFITVLHTHDQSGILHVESPTNRQFSLAEFFGVWGVKLTRNCIGRYCATPSTPLRAYVNGKRHYGDPGRIVLKSHEEIALVYGKAGGPIPKSYKFPAGD